MGVMPENRIISGQAPNTVTAIQPVGLTRHPLPQYIGRLPGGQCQLPTQTSVFFRVCLIADTTGIIGHRVSDMMLILDKFVDLTLQAVRRQSRLPGVFPGWIAVIQSTFSGLLQAVSGSILKDHDHDSVG